MEIKVKSFDQSDVLSMDISPEVFGEKYNEPLVHQVVVAYMAGARQGTSAQKTRSEVRGGGAKPWKQKGTGRARAGTIRSPIWRKGGVTFAAKTRDYSQKVNKKMYRVAIKSILSKLITEERLVIVDKFDIASPKTKLVVEKLNAINLKDVMIVVDAGSFTESLYLASRNIPNIGVCDAEMIDPVSLMAFKSVVMTRAAIEEIQERFL